MAGEMFKILGVVGKNVKNKKGEIFLKLLNDEKILCVKKKWLKNLKNAGKNYKNKEIARKIVIK